MNKLLITLGLTAIGAVLSNAATCTTTTLDTLTPLTTTCDFTDQGITWTLGNFSFNGSAAIGYPGGAQALATDVTVSFLPISTFAYTGLTLPGNIAGVFVKFEYSTTAANNFFVATENRAGASQQAAFEVSYNFTGAPANAFTNVFGVVDGLTIKACDTLTGSVCATDNGTNTGGGVSVAKNYSNSGPIISLVPNQKRDFDGHIQTGTLTPGQYYTVLDNYQMNPGTNSPFATASINYFGNGQYVNTTPEPMTMGMMGAGLLALGLLRRKSA